MANISLFMILRWINDYLHFKNSTPNIDPQQALTHFAEHTQTRATQDWQLRQALVAASFTAAIGKIVHRVTRQLIELAKPSTT